MKITITNPGRGSDVPVRSNMDHALRKIIDYGLLALIVFTPLPAASVHEWSILVIQLAVLVMTGAYVLMSKKPEINPYLSQRLKWLKYGSLGLFLFIGFQVIPLPAALVKILSPNTYSFHRLFSPHFPRMSFMSLSVVPAQTFRKGMELLACFLLGFLVIKTVTHGRQIRRLCAFIVGMAAFQTVYGLYELSTKSPRILFYKKIYNLDSVTGTFVNRSHLSGYLEMALPLAIGLLFARIDILSLAGQKFKDKVLLLAAKGLPATLLLLAGTVIISLGIIFAQSRAGIFILVFSFLLFFAFVVFHFGRIRSRQLWLKNFVWVTFLLVILLALYIGIGSTIERFTLDSFLHENRPLLWSNVVRIIADFPLFGSGLGTFVSVYPAYEKVGGPELLLVHAHNDYLESFSEIGFAGSVFFWGLVFYMAVGAFLVWRTRRNPDVKGIALGGIIALIGIALHSLTDFNLHIPANMLLFVIILSLTLVTAHYRKG